MRQYAVPAIRLAVQYCSISKPAFAFSSNLFSRKRTARLSPAVQVREETPLGGQRRRGVSGHRVSYFANRKIPRIDEAQFSTHVSCFEWRPFVLLPITSAGHGHLVPEGMLRQP
jgi:hypothetical protein